MLADSEKTKVLPAPDKHQSQLCLPSWFSLCLLTVPAECLYRGSEPALIYITNQPSLHVEACNLSDWLPKI